MKQFKIRCSAIGEIMAGNVGASDSQLTNIAVMEAREKPMTANQKEKYDKDIIARDNPQLPATAKTHCHNWLREQLYSRRKEISNKYCDKGNSVEDQSIRFLNSVLLTEYVKNEEYKENDYLTGTCDIKGYDHIRDMKNSWDCYTFPLFDHGIKEIGYKWQLQGYMELYDKDYGHLDYTLMDAPFHIVKQEAKRRAFKDGVDYEDIFSDVQALMTYSNLDNSLRYKTFFIERDHLDIQKVYKRVDMCRAYIESLTKNAEFIP